MDMADQDFTIKELKYLHSARTGSQIELWASFVHHPYRAPVNGIPVLLQGTPCNNCILYDSLCDSCRET